MADSVGSSVFPRTGIQEGHLHFNKDANTLHVYNGGDPSNIVNWSEVGGSGSAIASSSIQRWPFHMTGTEMSVGFGVSGEVEVIIPVDGTITKWGVIIGTVPTPVEFDIELIDDPFGGSDPIDIITIPISSTQLITENVLSFVVTANQVIGVFQITTFNPAVHDVKISGYIEFTPS